MENKSDKYFLCFGFGNFSQKNLSDFHVTIAYFGELKERELNSICNITGWFLGNGQPFEYMARVASVFDVQQMFGAQRTVPVLCLSKPAHTGLELAWKNAERLQSFLTGFRKGDLYEWNPHLTTHLSYFSGRINQVCLCRNDFDVIAAWKIV